MSTVKKAWNRVCDKFSPSKLTTMSPIDHTYAHTCKSRVASDDLLESLCLSVMISEENQYMNIISTIHEYHNDAKKLDQVLKGIRSTTNILDRLTDVYYISKGAFGRVYEAMDTLTNTKVALKNIIPEDDDQYKHMLSMWKILLERNILISISDSPFITRMIASFQDKIESSFWILMEFCHCNLTTFMKNVHGNFDFIEVHKKHLTSGNVIQKLNAFASRKLNFHYQDLVFIYFFEFLCALHFLADRHIVHCDLKPDNILLASNGHAKLSDLGAAQIFRLANKRSALHIINDFKHLKEIVERYDYDFRRSGNVVYLDPETSLRYLKASVPADFVALVKQNKLRRDEVSEKMTRQTFLTDLYAVGAVIMQMLLGGILLIHGSQYDLELLKTFELNALDMKYMNVTLGVNKHAFKSIIYDKFISSFSPKLKQLIKVLTLTIFRRQERVIEMLRDIQVFRNNVISIEKAINITEIEQLDYFWQKHVTMETVCNIILPKNVIEFCTSGNKQENREKISISDLNIQANDKLLSSFNFQFSIPFK